MSNWADPPIADVRALPGIRYYLARAGDPSTLVAPPYDVIPDSELPRYREMSPYNVVHLTRPGSDYQGAAATFASWMRDGILNEDPPSMYVHEVEFDGRRRRDLIAALRLQPYEDRVVLPHERTHRGPKEDRLALLRATGASLEPLWFLHEGVALPEPPPAASTLAFEYQGEQHTLAKVVDRDWQAAVGAAFLEQPLLIADGHHRYETTLAYSEELGGG